ncbi:MAG: class A beta-lactamase [Bacteroidota bacterium]
MNTFKCISLLLIVMAGKLAQAQEAKPTILPLRKQLHQLIDPFKAVVGVSVLHVEDGDTLTIHNAYRYPMQSVYKFPLAMAVLREVDKGKISLQQKLHITKEDLRPHTWSPLARLFPDGNIDVSVEELLQYTVSQSDNNTCDVLFRLMGGTKQVEKYIHGLGYKRISIKATEVEMGADIDSVTQSNWCHPNEMTRLLSNFYIGKYLSATSTSFLVKLMIESTNSNNRIKGLLPASTVVAHKTGTGNKIVNDVGIITLPDGKHVAIAVFVKDSKVEFEEVETMIAKISQTVFKDAVEQAAWRLKINAIVQDSILHAFNGVLLIQQKDGRKYEGGKGYADLENNLPLKLDYQFVIGSISKQIAAVMVLREYDKGHLQLHVPIKTYLPKLKMSWADTVTVHHLLIHMHGIEALDRPLLFEPGSRCEYGLANIGYHILSQIVEQVSGQSFAGNATILFNQCGMKSTFHPDIKKYKQLVKGYTEQADGRLGLETKSFQNDPAAGGFISTATDLLKWNEQLHKGKLLKPETYALMISPKEGAIRKHPVFGEVKYGYGITVDDGNLMQLGQTGFTPGFASMNFYFPQTQTSVIVLQNTVYHTTNLKSTFYHHLRILNEVKKGLTQ